MMIWWFLKLLFNLCFDVLLKYLVVVIALDCFCPAKLRDSSEFWASKATFWRNLAIIYFLENKLMFSQTKYAVICFTSRPTKSRKWALLLFRLKAALCLIARKFLQLSNMIDIIIYNWQKANYPYLFLFSSRNSP